MLARKLSRVVVRDNKASSALQLFWEQKWEFKKRGWSSYLSEFKGTGENQVRCFSNNLEIVVLLNSSSNLLKILHTLDFRQ